MFCNQCGGPLEQDARFCKNCGAPAGGEVYQSSVTNSKVMGILCYLSVLALIPFFLEKTDRFVRFHVNQGMTLLVFEAANFVLGRVFGRLSLPLSFGFSSIYSIVSGLLGLVFFAFSIIGIINVTRGHLRPLPVIGGITILK